MVKASLSVWLAVNVYAAVLQYAQHNTTIKENREHYTEIWWLCVHAGDVSNVLILFILISKVVPFGVSHV